MKTNKTPSTQSVHIDGRDIDSAIPVIYAAVHTAVRMIRAPMGKSGRKLAHQKSETEIAIQELKNLLTQCPQLPPGCAREAVKCANALGLSPKVNCRKALEDLQLIFELLAPIPRSVCDLADDILRPILLPLIGGEEIDSRLQEHRKLLAGDETQMLFETSRLMLAFPDNGINLTQAQATSWLEHRNLDASSLLDKPSEELMVWLSRDYLRSLAEWSQFLGTSLDRYVELLILKHWTLYRLGVEDNLDVPEVCHDGAGTCFHISSMASHAISELTSVYGKPVEALITVYILKEMEKERIACAQANETTNKDCKELLRSYNDWRSRFEQAAQDWMTIKAYQACRDLPSPEQALSFNLALLRLFVELDVTQLAALAHVPEQAVLRLESGSLIPQNLVLKICHVFTKLYGIPLDIKQPYFAVRYLAQTNRQRVQLKRAQAAILAGRPDEKMIASACRYLGMERNDPDFLAAELRKRKNWKSRKVAADNCALMRLALGLSIQEAARLAGISVEDANAIEMGRIISTNHTFLRYLKLLGLTRSDALEPGALLLLLFKYLRTRRSPDTSFW